MKRKKSLMALIIAKETASSAPNQPGAVKKGPHPKNTEALRRLKNIEGQVRGIHRMVEREKYCVDILTQISALRAALNKVGMTISRQHIEHCVTGAIRTGLAMRWAATELSRSDAGPGQGKDMKCP